MTNSIGIIWRGAVWFARLNTWSKVITLAGGSAIVTAVTRWFSGLSTFEAILVWLGVAALTFVFATSLAGFLQKRHSRSVLLSEAIEHISNDSIQGVVYRWRHGQSSGLARMGFGWKQLKDHGERGVIHVEGYIVATAQPVTITPEDWKSQGFGFEPGFTELMAFGKGQRWKNPRLPESELYRYWPPIPLVRTVRRIRAWLAANT